MTLCATKVFIRKQLPCFIGIPSRYSHTTSNPWQIPVSSPLPNHTVTTAQQYTKRLPDDIQRVHPEIPFHLYCVYEPDRYVLHGMMCLTNAHCQIPEEKDIGVLALGESYRLILDQIMDHTQDQMDPIISSLENLNEDIRSKVTQSLDELRGIATTPYFSKHLLSPSDLKLFLSGQPRDVNFIRHNMLTAPFINSVLTSSHAEDIISGYIYLHPHVLNHTLFTLLRPIFDKAIDELCIPRVPTYSPQSPLTTVASGAPTSGKSFARDVFRIYFHEKGFPSWREVVKVDADIFRRALLDINTLSKEDRPFHCTLTNCETVSVLEMLTHYLTHSNPEHSNIHLDNFYLTRSELISLSKKSKEVLLSFYFIPPEEAVLRNMLRGKAIGRYIKISSLLKKYQRTNQDFFKLVSGLHGYPVRFELLDKHVPLGDKPHLVAYGNLQKSRIRVYDVMGVMKLTQYSKINTHATHPDALYLSPIDRQPNSNLLGFQVWIDHFRKISFTDSTSIVTDDTHDYARISIDPKTQQKRLYILNPSHFEQVISSCKWSKTFFEWARSPSLRC